MLEWEATQSDQTGYAAAVVEALRADMIETLAGPMAEMRFRGGIVGPLYLRAELLSLYMSQDDLPAIEDAGRIQRALRWLMPADAKNEMTALWNETEVMLQAEWPGIMAMARILRERRYMEGDEFAEEWRRCRPSEAKRAKRIAGW